MTMFLRTTTRLGCGYDYRLRLEARKDFLVVEVKGLKERTGSLAFTPKEYEVAGALNERFFLFVVKNFGESPFRRNLSRSPFPSDLQFIREGNE